MQTGGKGERLYHMAMMKATKSAYYDAETGEYRYPSNKYEAALNGANYDSFWNQGKGIQSGGVMKIIQDSLNPFQRTGINMFSVREEFITPISRQAVERRRLII